MNIDLPLRKVNQNPPLSLEDKDPQPPRFYPMLGPGMRVWLLVALYFACSGLLMVLARSNALAWLSAGPDSGYPVDYARWAYAISGILTFAVPAVVFANVFPMERFGWFRLNVKVKPLALVFGVLAMIAFIPAANWLYTLILSSVTDPALKEYQEAVKTGSLWLEQMPGIPDLLVLLLTSALVPAVCEELFFRASLQQLFAEWLPNRVQLAPWFTAVIFSLIHFNPAAFPVIFLAGLMLGYAFHWTGSLRISILMHFLFNGISILENYAEQHSAAVAAWEPSGIFVAGCIAVTFVSFGLVMRFSGMKKQV